MLLLVCLVGEGWYFHRLPRRQGQRRDSASTVSGFLPGSWDSYNPICFPSSFADKAKPILRPQQRKPPQLLQWPERTPPNLSGPTDPSGSTRCCCCPLLPRAERLPPLESSPRSRAWRPQGADHGLRKASEPLQQSRGSRSHWKRERFWLRCLLE